MSKQPDWSYQNKMITEVLKHVHQDIGLLPNPALGCVLAGAVSSGKTRMALLVIDKLIKEGTVNSVLILAHGQTILRSQMFEEAKNLRAEGLIHFTFEAATTGTQVRDAKSQVVITLPQSMQFLKRLPTFDLVAVDEAHEFYFATMVKRIIRECHVKYTLCLTGTPSKFIDDKKFPIVAVSVLELLDYKVVTDPTVRLAQSCYDFTQKNYTKERNLSDTVKETAKQTKITMDDVLSVIHAVI